MGLAGFASALDLPYINRSKIRIYLVAGAEPDYGEIIVENPTAETKNMRVYLSDWYYLPAADGSKEFRPAGTLPLSCASWISFSPSELTLPPFSRQKVNYSIRAPEGARGGYYAALFFESLFAKQEIGKDEMSAGMNIAVRIATLFFIDVKNTVKRDCQLSNLKINNGILALDFKNTGNADITAAGTYHVMGSDGLIITRGQFDSVYTFAGSEAKMVSEFRKELPEGTYDLVVTLDLGKALEEDQSGRGPIVTKETSIEIGANGMITGLGELK